MANGFQLSQQVQVGGLPAPRVSALADDLSNLFGAVTKGAEKYAQVGEQAAKLEFQSKAVELQSQMTDIKRAIEADPYNTEFLREAGNTVEKLTADALAEGEKFKYSEMAYNAYNSLTTDYAASVRSAMLPMIDKKLFEATQFNIKTNTLNVADTLGGSATADNIRVEIDANSVANTGLDVPSIFIKQNDGAFTADFNANPAFLVRSHYIDQTTGKIDMRKGDEGIVNAYFSSFAKLNKDGVLEKANEFVTDQHLEIVSRAIAKSHSIFKDQNGNQRSSQLAVSLNNAESLKSDLDNGNIDIETAKQSVESARSNIESYYDFGSESQKNSADDMKLKLEASQIKYNFANGQLTKAIRTGGKAMGALLTNGYKGFSYTSNGVTNTEDIPANVFVNMAKTEIANIEKGLYNQDGSVNMGTLSNLIQITNQTGTHATSPAIDSILSGVFNSGAVNKQDVKGFLNDITIARYALKYKSSPYQNINQEFVNEKYLNSLETTLKAKQASKNPADDIAAAKAVAATGARGVEDWRVVATSFANSAYSKFKVNPDVLNRLDTLGEATWWSLNEQNSKTLTNRNVKYAGYQRSDDKTFLDSFPDVVTNEANSYKFTNVNLPNTHIKYIPIAYDDKNVPIPKDTFAAAVGTEITKRMSLGTAKSLAGVTEHKDRKSGGRFYIANLSKDTVDAEVIDTNAGSIVRVKVYGKDRKQNSKPLSTFDIRPNQFKQYNFDMGVIDAVGRWFSE